MTPKEKAKELVLEMELAQSEGIRGYNYDTAKQCALICVDEIIDTFLDIDTKKRHWQEVKQEIEEL